MQDSLQGMMTTLMMSWWRQKLDSSSVSLLFLVDFDGWTQ